MWFKHRNNPSVAERERIAVLETERVQLTDELINLKRRVSELAGEAKIAEEDIKHMIRMREESMALDFDKRVVAEERKTAEAIAKVKDDYRDKLEERLQTEVANMKEMYAQILERLPNISARLKGDVGT